MHFLASDQDEDRTRKRISRAECYVAFHGQQMIGTIVWRDVQQTGGCPWYDRTDVASFGQFAIDPQWQRQGIGSKLLAIAEQRLLPVRFRAGARARVLANATQQTRGSAR